MIYSTLLMVHVVLSVLLITLILIQQGKGAQIGAAFGSGASQTLFGSQGSGNFVTKITSLLVALFFMNCLWMANIANKMSTSDPLDALQNVPGQAEPLGPADSPSHEGIGPEVEGHQGTLDAEIPDDM